LERRVFGDARNGNLVAGRIEKEAA
jgi:hypothetical protein